MFQARRSLQLGCPTCKCPTSKSPMSFCDTSSKEVILHKLWACSLRWAVCPSESVRQLHIYESFSHNLGKKLVKICSYLEIIKQYFRMLWALVFFFSWVVIYWIAPVKWLNCLFRYIFKSTEQMLKKETHLRELVKHFDFNGAYYLL